MLPSDHRQGVDKRRPEASGRNPGRVVCIKAPPAPRFQTRNHRLTATKAGGPPLLSFRRRRSLQEAIGPWGPRGDLEAAPRKFLRARSVGDLTCGVSLCHSATKQQY